MTSSEKREVGYIKSLKHKPLGYCQYCSGPCDQEWAKLEPTTGFFVYPRDPVSISSTIGKAIKDLKSHSSNTSWMDWRKLPIHGKIIFCEICKAICLTGVVVSDITTLNFNVLFELGYAIGEGKPVLPIRDTTYERDHALFEALGIFDTIGYKDFQSSRDIVSVVTKPKPSSVIKDQNILVNRQQPIYYIKSPIDTDASIKLNSSLKKGAFDLTLPQS